MTMSKSFKQAMKEMYHVHFIDPDEKDHEKWLAEYEEYRQKIFSVLGVPKKILKNNIDGYCDCPKCGAPVVSSKGEWIIPKHFINADCVGYQCSCGNAITGGDPWGITKKDESTLRALGVPEDTLTMIFGKPKEDKPKTRPRRRITIPEEVKLRRAEDGND